MKISAIRRGGMPPSCRARPGSPLGESREAARPPLQGKRLIEQMRGRGDIKMSTDEIMALTRGER